MKKKNFKLLGLNKKAISNFNTQKTYGGGEMTAQHDFICVFSVVDNANCMSDRGCSGGTDETMTCPDWSCRCPVK